MIGHPPTETETAKALALTGNRSGSHLWVVECYACGFTPNDQTTTRQGRCPKCHGFGWRRVNQSRRSLALYATAHN